MVSKMLDKDRNICGLADPDCGVDSPVEVDGGFSTFELGGNGSMVSCIFE